MTLYFPPAGGGGVQRSLKLATHLPALGIETHVLAPDDPKWVYTDRDLPVESSRTIKGALGPIAILLSGGTVIYAIPLWNG